MKAGFYIGHESEIVYQDGDKDPWFVMVHDCA